MSKQATLVLRRRSSIRLPLLWILAALLMVGAAWYVVMSPSVFDMTPSLYRVLHSTVELGCIIPLIALVLLRYRLSV